jgi:hypothetical protein
MTRILVGRGSAARRARNIRRASAGLTPIRAGAALVMLLAALGIYGAGASPAFSYRQLAVEADERALVGTEAVRAALDLESTLPNLFLLDTDALETRLEALPPVSGAEVSVRLPDTVAVRLVERSPILVWAVGQKRLLLDGDGRIFSASAGAAGVGLPVIVDRRAASAALDVGAQVAPVDLDAATRFASLQPSQLGSHARGLIIVIGDENGYELRPEGKGWVAYFGLYTPTLRTPELIPGQVRLLRSLIENREDAIARVTLADDRNGTYTTQ